MGPIQDLIGASPARFMRPWCAVCPECGEEIEIGDWVFCPHGSTRPEYAQRFEPVVIHRDAQGNIRTPGSIHAPVPAGFERVELRTAAEIRHFEREMNRRERSRGEDVRSREEQHWGAQKAASRSELFQAMRGMSNEGRDYARYAIEQGNQRRHRLASYDPGFHIEAFSQDASNREAHSDSRTGWKGRK
jgi:hypothetical protein